MPIYEFKCESCSHIDEVLMKISDPAPEKCSLCGAKVKKIMSQSSFSLKGTGWYATDYKKSEQSKPSENKEGETKPSDTKETTEPAKSTEPIKPAESNTAAKVI